MKKRQHETDNLTGDGITKKKPTQTGKNTHKTKKTLRDALVYKKIFLKGHKFPRPQGKREKKTAIPRWALTDQQITVKLLDLLSSLTVV